MQSPFGVKRKARRIAQEDAEESTSGSAGGDVEQAPDATPTVIRPSLSSRGSISRTKKRPSLRKSLGPGGTSMNDDEDDSSSSAVFTPKRSNLSRQAMEKNALRKSLNSSIPPDRFPPRNDDDRPSYSADIINELKASTPSTPQDLRSQSDMSQSDGKKLDLAAKFGTDLAIRRDAAIPTEAEIREKKQRRARLAKEQEFISLDSDGEPEDAGRDDSDSDASSNNETSILPYTGPRRAKEPPSRLAEDDYEMGEGFDDFVSDGRMALGKRAEREQRRRQKAEMKNMIEDAEGSDDSSEDESEVERRAAYEVAQTQKGMDGLKKQEDGPRPRRPRTPPKITPLPTLGGVLERLRERLQGREYERKIQEARLDAVRKELADIEVRKVEVQSLMTEAGRRFEKLRAELEAEKGGAEVTDMVERERAGLGVGSGMRGLENLGTS